MDMLDRMRMLAQRKGLQNNAQLAKASGVPYTTLDNFFRTGYDNAKLTTLKKLANCLGCTLEYLVNGDPKNEDRITPWHTPLTVAYEAAVIPVRESACRVLSIDYVDPVTRTGSKAAPLTEPEEMHEECGEEEDIEDLRLYANPSAAGSGSTLFEDEYCETRPYLKSIIPEKTDFAIRITGNSMEPGISDGDIVFVRETPEVLNHQVGIFVIKGDQAVCKRAKYDERGRLVRLMSDNPEVSDIMVSKLPDRRVRVVGRVLGVHRDGE